MKLGKSGFLESLPLLRTRTVAGGGDLNVNSVPQQSLPGPHPPRSGPVTPQAASRFGRGDRRHQGILSPGPPLFGGEAILLDRFY